MICAGTCVVSPVVFAGHLWGGTPAATSKTKISSASLTISGTLGASILDYISIVQLERERHGGGGGEAELFQCEH